jgi:hypothetical protein
MAGNGALSSVRRCQRPMRAARSLMRSCCAESLNRLVCSYGSVCRLNSSHWSPAQRFSFQRPDTTVAWQHVTIAAVQCCLRCESPLRWMVSQPGVILWPPIGVLGESVSGIEFKVPTYQARRRVFLLLAPRSCQDPHWVLERLDRLSRKGEST